MRPAGNHNVQFQKRTDKDVVPWDKFKGPREISDKTQLRMLANRVRINVPRRLDEPNVEYSERIAKVLVQRGKSHLDEFDTAVLIDKWFWSGVYR